MSVDDDRGRSYNLAFFGLNLGVPLSCYEMTLYGDLTLDADRIDKGAPVDPVRVTASPGMLIARQVRIGDILVSQPSPDTTRQRELAPYLGNWAFGTELNGWDNNVLSLGGLVDHAGQPLDGVVTMLPNQATDLLVLNSIGQIRGPKLYESDIFRTAPLPDAGVPA